MINYFFTLKIPVFKNGDLKFELTSDCRNDFNDVNNSRNHPRHDFCADADNLIHIKRFKRACNGTCVNY